MKKKIIFIVLLVLVAIMLIAGIIYASSLAKEKDLAKREEPLFKEDISLDEFTSESGLIFTLSKVQTDNECVPVVLEVYKDGKYIYADKMASDSELEGYNIPVYTDAYEGTYDYDILSIFKDLKVARQKYYTNTTGTYTTYLTDKNNKSLKNFFISSSSPLTYTKGHPAPPHPIWGIKRSRAIALSSTNFRFSLVKFRHLIFILLVPSVLDTNVIFSILFPFCQLAF